MTGVQTCALPILDDNGINVTSEMTEMIRNAYQQQYLYQAINKHYGLLRMAVKGQ